MDGYIRANTDDKGKIIDIWDEWYRDPDLGDYMGDCGIDCYFQDYTLKPNSLILITFNYKSEVTESYMYGKEYDEWIEVEHEIVLIEDYNYEDIEERDINGTLHDQRRSSDSLQELFVLGQYKEGF